MYLKKVVKKAACYVLSAALVLTSFSAGSFVNTKTSMAYVTGDFDDASELTATQVPDATLLRVLRVLTNYYAENKTAPEAGKVLTDSEFDDYDKAVTVKKAATFVGDIDLAPYTVATSGSSKNYDPIKDISGIGFMRRATSVNLSNINITSISAGEFFMCEELTKVVIPSTVTEIKDQAFQNCSSLVSLTYSDKTYDDENVIDLTRITSIGKDAFNSCSALNYVYLDNITSLVIKDTAFFGCSSLSYIDLTMIQKADNLGVGAFGECSSLEEAVLYDSLDYIPEGLFASAGANLKDSYFTVNIPKTISKIGANAFYNSSIADVDFSGMTALTIVDDGAFGGTLIQEADFSECSSLKSIGYGSFANTLLLESVKLPSSLISIGGAAFQYSFIKSINIPAGVEAINDETFAFTYLLDDITFDSGSKCSKICVGAFRGSGIDNTDFLLSLAYLKEIDAVAFANSGVEAVNLPASVASMGAACFAHCKSLNALDMSKTRLMEIPESCFSGESEVIDKNSGKQGYPDDNNDVNPTIETIYLPETLKEIGYRAFYLCGSIKTATYGDKDETAGLFECPNGLTKIGEEAFSKSGLINVKLSDTVAEMGKRVMAESKSLNQVELSTGLEKIPDYGFYECDNLKYVEMKYGLKEIGSYAFQADFRYVQKYNGTVGEFPATLEIIGDYAFNKDYSLLDEGFSDFYDPDDTSKVYERDEVNAERLVFPTTLKKIGTFAFSECTPQREKYDEVEDEGLYILTTDETKGYKNVLPGDIPIRDAGLRRIDFSYAKNLETIGASAFSKNSLVSVDLSQTILSAASRDTFADNYYLETAVLPSTVQTVEDLTFNQTCSLKRVTVPASATLKENFIYAYFDTGNTPTISLSTPNEPEIIQIDRDVEISVGVIDLSHISGAVSFTIIDNETKQEYKLSSNGETSDGTKATLYEGNEECPVSLAVTSSNGYKVKITGKKAGDYTLNITAAFLFDYLNVSAGKIAFINQSISMSYKLNITEIAPNSITITDDNIIDTGKKDLYLAYDNTSATNEYTVSAQVDPMDVSIDPTWSVDSTSFVLGESTYDRETGITSIKITASGYASGKLSVSYNGTTMDVVTLHTVSKAKSISYTIDSTNSEAQSITMARGWKDKVVCEIETVDSEAAAQDAIQYSTSDESVVTINAETGEIVAVGEGEATITIKSITGSIVKNISIKVETDYTAEATSVVIDEDNTQSYVIVGGTIDLVGSVLPKTVSQNLTWESSDVTIATITGNKLTGVKAGSVTVTASSGDKKDTMTIKVVNKVPVMRLLSNQVYVAKDGTTTLSFTNSEKATEGIFVESTDFGEEFEVKVADESVVKGEISGKAIKFTGLKQGTTQVTVTGKDSGETLTFNLSCYTPLTKLTLSGAQEIAQGGTATLTVTKEASDSLEPVTWKTSDEKTATVDSNGVVTAVKAGKVTITVSAAYTKSVSATYEIVITNPATKVIIKTKSANNRKIYLKKGDSTSIKALVSPEDTTDTVTYKSTKAKVAAVDDSGNITTKRVGRAVIKVITSSGKTASVNVFVVKRAKKAKKVIVSKPRAIQVGKTTKLTVKVKAANATGNLTYTSSDSSKLTVDEYGYVTGVAKGKVKVTVATSTGRKGVRVINVK
ncbi:MAG: leucine-rich repeat protein [Lachnospiraceae bacterium]|nr:leucine-rich repeat protein [Lachnospiraceae bacterium]